MAAGLGRGEVAWGGILDATGNWVRRSMDFGDADSSEEREAVVALLAGAMNSAVAPEPPDSFRVEDLRTFDALLFDLDGTLWDSCATIAAAWNEALRLEGRPERFGLPEVAGIMGLTFEEIFAKLFPGEAAEVQRHLGERMELQEGPYLQRLGGIPYPGVEEGLGRLAARWPLALVSNCQDGYIENFLAATGLGERFADFESHGRTQRPKSENIAAVMARNGWKRALYLGDTAKDGRAAAKAGLRFAFACWGFGERPEMEPLAFASFADLEAWLAGCRSTWSAGGMGENGGAKQAGTSADFSEGAR